MLFRVMQAKPMAALDRFIYHRGVRGNSFHFVCHTKEVKESYKEYLDGMFYDETNVIPLGRKKLEQKAVSQGEARKYLHLPQEAKIFLSFGTNHPGKNLEVIFQAAQDMPKDLYFIFAGKLVESGGARDPVALAQEYGWAKNTIVVNQFIPDEEKPYYFYASDAILLSYIRSATAYASVLNDACQFQLPVIASDVGQLGEDVTTYSLGTTFIPEDADSLRQAIVSFLSLTEAEILTMKANCRKFVSSFSTEDEANKYIALYSLRA
jgi:glycosyltransferase involved in cell wall biosynthesis